jgi:hypothetical protein
MITQKNNVYHKNSIHHLGQRLALCPFGAAKLHIFSEFNPLAHQIPRLTLGKGMGQGVALENGS